jgi:hypothetical protein
MTTATILIHMIRKPVKRTIMKVKTLTACSVLKSG